MDDIGELLKGNKRIVARTISAVENDTAKNFLETIYPHTGHAYHVGITGPPGAGKSTLVSAIAKRSIPVPLFPAVRCSVTGCV
jgi:LAO/AO transport system kinase